MCQKPIATSNAGNDEIYEAHYRRTVQGNSIMDYAEVQKECVKALNGILGAQRDYWDILNSVALPAFDSALPSIPTSAYNLPYIPY